MRGSKVILHLKQDALEFANEERIKGLIQRYSEFVHFPIELRCVKTITKEVEVEDEEIKNEGENKDDEALTEEEKEKKAEQE